MNKLWKILLILLIIALGVIGTLAFLSWYMDRGLPTTKSRFLVDLGPATRDFPNSTIYTRIVRNAL